MQHIERGDFMTVWLWAFLDIVENFQKIKKKTIRTFDPINTCKIQMPWINLINELSF